MVYSNYSDNYSVKNDSIFLSLKIACYQAELLSGSFVFLFSLALQFVLALTAICFNVILFLLTCRNPTLHINLRILFGHTMVAIVWYCSGYLAKALYALVVLAVNPCYLVTEAFSCKIQEIPSIGIPYLMTNYSMVAIGVERFYATMTYRHYERSRNVAPSVGLLAIMWTGILCQQLLPLLAIEKGAKFLPLCINLLSITETSARTVITLTIGVELLSLALHMMNLKINTMKLNTVYIDQTQENLSARFQLDQNFKVTRVVVAIVIAHMVCQFPQSVFMAVFFYGEYYRTSMDSVIHYIVFPFVLNATFGILFAVVTFVRNPLIRQDLKNYFPGFYKLFETLCFLRNRRTAKVDTTYRLNDDSDAVAQKHFEMLETLWSGGHVHNVKKTK